MFKIIQIAVKKWSIFILLLYVSVLTESAVHIHGYEVNPLPNAKIAEPTNTGSSHYAVTPYSACYIVVFAGASYLETKKTFLSVELGVNGTIAPKEIRAEKFHFLTSHLVRGPPNGSLS